MHKTHLALAGILLYCWFSPLSACECQNGALPLAEEYANAELVFSAKIISTETCAPDKILKIRFELLESFKGAVSRLEHLFTPQLKADCGYPFQADEAYLIFAFTHPDPVSLIQDSPEPVDPEPMAPGQNTALGEAESRVWVLLCSPTKPLAQAQEEIADIKSIKQEQTRQINELILGADYPQTGPEGD